jgi:hypothetical protein
MKYTVMKTNKLKDKIKKFKIVVDPNMPSYRNDPYFIRKAEKAKEYFLKYGLPKNWEIMFKNTR